MIEEKRQAYNLFADLVNSLKNFSTLESDRTTEALLHIAKSIQTKMPLPSGRWGNALAVALEMQLYKGALVLLENAEALQMSPESVSSEYDGKNVWDAKQTLEFSERYFDKMKLEKDDAYYKNYPAYIQSHNSNIDAFYKIQDMLKERVKK